jgi:hypothetical protein
MNHARDANIMPVAEGDDIYAIALRDIQLGDELLVDYRASMQVNFALLKELT